MPDTVEDLGTAIKTMPKLKEAELARLGPCAVCGQPLLGSPHSSVSFYKVKVDHLVWNLDAVKRQAGLGIAMGSPILARVMGPDLDLATQFVTGREVVVHEECAGKINHLAVLFEREKSP